MCTAFNFRSHLVFPWLERLRMDPGCRMGPGFCPIMCKSAPFLLHGFWSVVLGMNIMPPGLMVCFCLFFDGNFLF